MCCVLLNSSYSASAKAAKDKAEAEYDEFNKTQHIESDFDQMVKHLMDETNGAK